MIPKRILILGSSGFVGSYLSDYLKSHYLVTNASHNKPADFQFDITNDKLEGLEQFDCIINCVVSYDNQLMKDFDVNVKGTLSILNQISDLNCHYINISSISALPENYKNSSYSLTKFLSDAVTDYFRFKSKLKITTLRFSQIYDARGVANNSQPGLYFFARKIKKNESLIIFGDKNIMRSYIPIELLCKTVGLAIANEITGDHNIIMKDTYSPYQLALAFTKMCHYDTGKIEFEKDKPLSEYEIPACSDYFIPILEGENNISYFKILFDNV